MSIANAKNSPAIEPRPARETTPQAPTRRPTPGLDQDQGLLLAQIPDLDPIAAPKVPAKRLDGRIISQALSTKVIFGVGLGLVVGAILPFVFGRGSRHETPVTELPAWSNPGGPSVSGNTAQNAPSWPASPTAQNATPFPPQTPAAQSPAILYPQQPQVSEARPAGLSEPPWPQTRSSVPPPAALGPPPTSAYNPPLANTAPRDNRGDYRGFDRPADPRTLSADNRNNPTNQYRNGDPQFDYRANPAEANPVRHDVPANGYSGDNRYNSPNNSYPPSAGPSSPLMPSGAATPTSTYRDPQYADPGVARFDGTIGTPSGRPGYGPSNQ